MQKILITDVRDMNLDHVFGCGQCFRWNRNDNGEYEGVVRGAYVKVRLDDGILDILSTKSIDWNEYFDLSRDYGSIKDELNSKDHKITDAVKYGYGIRILRQDLWEVMISFIISQNNNIPRIKGAIEKLSELYGNKIGEFNGKSYYSFPEPKVIGELTENELSQVRLGYRAKYLPSAAKKFIEDGMTGDNLLSYKGIGPKVANCINLFGMNDIKAFPIDLWVERVMKEIYGIEGKKNIEEFAKRNFGEYGGIAQQYLFYYIRGRGV